MMRADVKALVISLVLLLFSPVVVFAQTPEASHMVLATPSATVQLSDYVLPYPGLLPDNPLYPLKTARDRIVGFLISDPLKKASFDLLQADKRLQAGVYLIQTEGKSKEQLAEQTISKGQNYLSESVTKLQEAKTQGRDVKDMARTISNASQKHEEVLTDLSMKVSAQEKPPFMTLLERIHLIRSQVAHFTKK